MMNFECYFCGADITGYPEVVLWSNGGEEFNNLFNKTRDKVIESIGAILPPALDKDYIIQKEAWNDFYKQIGRDSFWFCSYECARNHLESLEEQENNEQENTNEETF